MTDINILKYFYRKGWLTELKLLELINAKVLNADDADNIKNQKSAR
jgi:hypothetical protein